MAKNDYQLVEIDLGVVVRSCELYEWNEEGFRFWGNPGGFLTFKPGPLGNEMRVCYGESVCGRVGKVKTQGSGAVMDFEFAVSLQAYVPVDVETEISKLL